MDFTQTNDVITRKFIFSFFLKSETSGTHAAGRDSEKRTAPSTSIPDVSRIEPSYATV